VVNLEAGGLAALTSRIGEIEGRLGTMRPAAGSPASAAAFASTLGQVLTSAAGSAGSPGASAATGTAGTAANSTTATDATATSTAATSTASTDAGSSAATGARALDLAKTYAGVPYLWGGTDPSKGLDCSGLVQLVYRRLGVDLPRTSAQQAKVGERVASLDDARPGDLVFFGSPVHHVGIYAGDGRMVDAPRRGKTVGLHDVWSGVSAIRRVTPATSAGGAGPATQTLAAGPSLAAAPAPAVAPAASGSSTTLNQVVAADYGFGPVAPGGVMGQTGTRLVSRTVAATSTYPVVTGDRAGSVAGSRRPGAVPAAGSGATAGLSGPYADLFVAAGRRHGVDPALLSAVAKAESGYDPAARSPAGAIGLMQIMPGTAKDLGVDPRDPAQAVEGAARLLSRHLTSYDGKVDLALAAYNAGPGAVRRYGGVPPYAETTAYVRRVTAYWKDLG
jgi:cell wall-associated NlpC family hydrolase